VVRNLPPRAAPRIEQLHQDYQKALRTTRRPTIADFQRRCDLARRYAELHGVDGSAQQGAQAQVARAAKEARRPLRTRSPARFDREVRLIAQQRGISVVLSDVVAPAGGVDLTPDALKRHRKFARMIESRAVRPLFAALLLAGVVVPAPTERRATSGSWDVHADLGQLAEVFRTTISQEPARRRRAADSSIQSLGGRDKGRRRPVAALQARFTQAQTELSTGRQHAAKQSPADRHLTYVLQPASTSGTAGSDITADVEKRSSRSTTSDAGRR